MSREFELKLELAPGDGARLGRHPLIAAIEPARARQLSVYFDTKRGKLRKAGYTLRVRGKGGRFVQTIKPEAGAAGLFDRDEWESDVAGLRPEPEACAGTPLAELLGRADFAKLVPVVRADVERTAWVVDHRQARLELVLDQGEIEAGGETSRIDELEIERLDGDGDAVFSFAQSIGEGVALKLGVLSKAERGFALADGSLRKVSKAAAIRLDGEKSAAEGVTLIVHACLRHFRLNEPLVLERRDAGALHQARVAMRRLRAALSLFGPLLRDEGFAALREELRWFTAQLGDARNFDVYLGRLGGDPNRAGIEALREAAYDAVTAAMDSERFRRLMLDLVAWLHTGDWRRRKKARLPLAAVAGRRLDARWEKIAGAGASIGAMEEEPRHRLRIEVKKLRYGLEFLRALHETAPRRQKKFLAELEGLQEELGYLNDLATARAMTSDLQSTDAAPEDAAAPAPSEEEASHLANSEKHFHALRKIGPYWH